MILLTGADGFVGNFVLNVASSRAIKIRPICRSIDALKRHPNGVLVNEPYFSADLSNALHGIDVVIHTAARTHIVRNEALDPLDEFRRVNVEGTLNLARQAATAGVRRFVLISSIKVNGEATLLNRPFAADDPHAPVDAYALSKTEAEAQLKQVANETGMEFTIIRPPLIYGPGVRGNLGNLISWISRGLPLPMGGEFYNRRSLVGLDNLADLILVCADHPKAANQVFLVSDGEDLSTTELLRKIGKALGRPARLLWVPAGVISFIAGLLGKELIAQRLLGSLQVDIRKTCELLDWRPSVTVDEGLRRALE
jgi:nucleoside-diphosphate-sugar epimerase